MVRACDAGRGKCVQHCLREPHHQRAPKHPGVQISMQPYLQLFEHQNNHDCREENADFYRALHWDLSSGTYFMMECQGSPCSEVSKLLHMPLTWPLSGQQRNRPPTENK
ncbi:unnamed protein product [Acanthoscelides obtectus]|uniref:Uncharacterized protein n=1 Tax=Acanthoscelides obtectus TaxID=200917 RepID=A0A9P0PW19_ACAOB|nr:unnamed protein product [Acanthoscelides obtectus]CAK1621708.1 hypothetical protein AOBTE_LOCUS1089 [Acanthoscelides obtectus]